MTAFSLPANDRKEVKKVFKEEFSVEILCLVKQLILRQFFFLFRETERLLAWKSLGVGGAGKNQTFSGLFPRRTMGTKGWVKYWRVNE